jgi:hypothetical protein
MLSVTRNFVTSYLIIHRKELHLYSKKMEIFTKLQVLGILEHIRSPTYEFIEGTTGQEIVWWDPLVIRFNS